MHQKLDLAVVAKKITKKIAKKPNLPKIIQMKLQIIPVPPKGMTYFIDI